MSHTQSLTNASARIRKYSDISADASAVATAASTLPPRDKPVAMRAQPTPHDHEPVFVITNNRNSPIGVPTSHGRDGLTTHSAGNAQAAHTPSTAATAAAGLSAFTASPAANARPVANMCVSVDAPQERRRTPISRRGRYPPGSPHAAVSSTVSNMMGHGQGYTALLGDAAERPLALPTVSTLGTLRAVAPELCIIETDFPDSEFRMRFEQMNVNSGLVPLAKLSPTARTYTHLGISDDRKDGSGIFPNVGGFLLADDLLGGPRWPWLRPSQSPTGAVHGLSGEHTAPSAEAGAAAGAGGSRGAKVQPWGHVCGPLYSLQSLGHAHDTDSAGATNTQTRGHGRGASAAAVGGKGSDHGGRQAASTRPGARDLLDDGSGAVPGKAVSIKDGGAVEVTITGHRSDTAALDEDVDARVGRIPAVGESWAQTHTHPWPAAGRGAGGRVDGGDEYTHSHARTYTYTAAQGARGGAARRDDEAEGEPHKRRRVGLHASAGAGPVMETQGEANKTVLGSAHASAKTPLGVAGRAAARQQLLQFDAPVLEYSGSADTALTAAHTPQTSESAAAAASVSGVGSVEEVAGLTADRVSVAGRSMGVLAMRDGSGLEARSGAMDVCAGADARGCASKEPSEGVDVGDNRGVPAATAFGRVHVIPHDDNDDHDDQDDRMDKHVDNFDKRSSWHQHPSSCSSLSPSLAHAASMAAPQALAVDTEHGFGSTTFSHHQVPTHTYTQAHTQGQANVVMPAEAPFVCLNHPAANTYPSSPSSSSASSSSSSSALISVQASPLLPLPAAAVTPRWAQATLDADVYAGAGTDPADGKHGAALGGAFAESAMRTAAGEGDLGGLRLPVLGGMVDEDEDENTWGRAGWGIGALGVGMGMGMGVGAFDALEATLGVVGVPVADADVGQDPGMRADTFTGAGLGMGMGAFASSGVDMTISGGGGGYSRDSSGHRGNGVHHAQTQDNGFGYGCGRGYGYGYEHSSFAQDTLLPSPTGADGRVGGWRHAQTHGHAPRHGHGLVHEGGHSNGSAVVERVRAREERDHSGGVWGGSGHELGRAGAGYGHTHTRTHLRSLSNSSSSSSSSADEYGHELGSTHTYAHAHTQLQPHDGYRRPHSHTHSHVHGQTQSGVVAVSHGHGTRMGTRTHGHGRPESGALPDIASSQPRHSRTERPYSVHGHDTRGGNGTLAMGASVRTGWPQDPAPATGCASAGASATANSASYPPVTGASAVAGEAGTSTGTGARAGVGLGKAIGRVGLRERGTRYGAEEEYSRAGAGVNASGGKTLPYVHAQAHAPLHAVGQGYGGGVDGEEDVEGEYGYGYAYGYGQQSGSYPLGHAQEHTPYTHAQAGSHTSAQSPPSRSGYGYSAQTSFNSGSLPLTPYGGTASTTAGGVGMGLGLGGAEEGDWEGADAPMKRRSKLPLQAVLGLRTWLKANICNPYPSATQKQLLAAQLALQPSQVHNWLSNVRKRCLAPWLRSIGVTLQPFKPLSPSDAAYVMQRAEETHKDSYLGPL